MERAELNLKVQRIVSEQLGVKFEEVTQASTLSDLGADSLDVVEVVMEVESEFDIEISDEAITELGEAEMTVELLTNTVEQQIG